jgi:hypothetical protein
MRCDGAITFRDIAGKLTVLRTSHQVIHRWFDSPRYYRPVIVFGAARDLAVIINLEHCACPTTERQGGGFHFTPSRSAPEKVPSPITCPITAPSATWTRSATILKSGIAFHHFS